MGTSTPTRVRPRADAVSRSSRSQRLNHPSGCLDIWETNSKIYYVASKTLCSTKFYVGRQYRKVAYFELSSHQISEPNNRLSVRTSISQMPQRGSLINQRGRRISLFPDVFSYVSLPTLSTDADRRYLSFDQHSHSHAFSLSVSPLPSLTFFHL